MFSGCLLPLSSFVDFPFGGGLFFMLWIGCPNQTILLLRAKAVLLHYKFTRFLQLPEWAECLLALNVCMRLWPCCMHLALIHTSLMHTQILLCAFRNYLFLNLRQLERIHWRQARCIHISCVRKQQTHTKHTQHADNNAIFISFAISPLHSVTSISSLLCFALI